MPLIADDDPCPTCLNGGTCHIIGSTLSCVCPQDYTGPLCETPVISNCPSDLCDVVYNSGYDVFRSDEGDLIQVSAYAQVVATCSSMHGCQSA